VRRPKVRRALVALTFCFSNINKGRRLSGSRSAGSSERAKPASSLACDRISQLEAFRLPSLAAKPTQTAAEWREESARFTGRVTYEFRRGREERNFFGGLTLGRLVTSAHFWGALAYRSVILNEQLFYLAAWSLILSGVLGFMGGNTSARSTQRSPNFSG